MTDQPDPELLRRMEASLWTLPRLDRQIFLAIRLDDLSYPEIAKITGLSVGQVERRFARALHVVLNDRPYRPWWRRWWQAARNSRDA